MGFMPLGVLFIVAPWREGCEKGGLTSNHKFCAFQKFYHITLTETEPMGCALHSVPFSLSYVPPDWGDY